jgi:hypothetical protein
MFPQPWRRGLDWDTRVESASRSADAQWWSALKAMGDQLAAYTSSAKGKGKASGQTAAKGKGKGKGRGLATGSSTGVAASTPCGCCGNVGHAKLDCHHRAKLCNKCGKKGHLSQICKAQAEPPDTSPKERVPGAGQKSYLEATLRTPWTCPRCRHLVGGECKACQRVNCNGKKPTPTPKVTEEVKEETFLSKTFQKTCDTAVSTDADTEMVDAEAVAMARRMLEMCQEAGTPAMLALAVTNLRDVLAARPVAQEADPRTELSCSHARFRATTQAKQWKVENDEAEREEKEHLHSIELSTAKFKEDLAAKYKMDLEAIEAQSIATLAFLKQETEVREQKFTGKMAVHHKDLAKINAAQSACAPADAPPEPMQEAPSQGHAAAINVEVPQSRQGRKDARAEMDRLDALEDEDEALVLKESLRINAQEEAAEVQRLRDAAAPKHLEDAKPNMREREGSDEAPDPKKSAK